MKFTARLRDLAPSLAGWVLLGIGIVVAVFGYVALHGWCGEYIISDFYANASTTLIGTAVVVLIIDKLNQARSAAAARAALVRDMASSDNGLALRGARELRALGRLTDGYLDLSDFSRASLEDGSLEMLRSRGSRFQGSRMTRADLSRADLAGAVFNRADLSHCNLEMAVLEHASFLETTLVDADLGDAKLADAILSGAVARGADFRGADLQRVKLDGVDLTSARMSGAKIGGAIINKATKLPAGAPGTNEGLGDYRHWPDDTIWP